MKPKFSLRIKHVRSLSTSPSTKSEAAVARKRLTTKNKQLEEAVAWCVENNKRGFPG